MVFYGTAIEGNKSSACNQFGAGSFAPELQNGFGKCFSFQANPFQQPNTLFTPCSTSVSVPSSTASPFGAFQTSAATDASSASIWGGSGTGSLTSIFQPSSGFGGKSSISDAPNAPSLLVQGNSSNGSFGNTTFQFSTPTGCSFPSSPSTSTSATSSLFSNQNAFSTTGVPVPSTSIFSSSTPSKNSCSWGSASSGGLITSGIQNSCGSEGRMIQWGYGDVPYSPTPEAGVACNCKPKMMSISAMPAYGNKSHEELRMEDYESSNAAGRKTPLDGRASFDSFNTRSNMFSFQARSKFSPFLSNQSPKYSQAFDIPTSTIPKSQEFAKSVTSFPSTPKPFSGFNPFTPSSSTAFTSPFTKSSSELTFTFTPNHFSWPSPPTQSVPSKDAQNPSFSTISQPSSLVSNYSYKSPFSFLKTTESAFQPQNIVPSSMPASTMTINTSVSQSLTPDSKQPPQLSMAPSPWSTITPSRPPFSSETTSNPQTSYPNSSQSGQFAQNTGFLSTCNLNQPLEAPRVLPKATEINSQNADGELSSSTLAKQPSPIMDPFGPRTEVNTSVYPSDSRTDKPSGISSIAVSYNPSPLKKTPLLVRIRNLSLRQNRLSAQKLEESAFPERKEDLPHSAAPLMPRMNPRSWILNPASSGTEDKVHAISSLPPLGKSASATDELGAAEKDCHATSSLHQAGYPKVTEQQNTFPLFPKLGREDYYTEPSINLLMEKEKSQPGFCSRVSDFVVGRRHYGSIKFLGQTDIRDLDLESIIQFNNREVIVYADTRVKPPEGHALNKPAEITLLNVKCIDKKTGTQYTEGAQVHKYEEMLIKRTEEQGAEFISFDPVQGEWKFRVRHF